MSTVALEEILAEREHRALRRQKLIFEHQCPVITFTLNLAGPEKRGRLSDFVFGKGVALLKSRLGEPLFYECLSSSAGLCAFFGYREHASVLKKVCMEIEERECGRIFDFDVTDEHETGISRSVPRRCLLCSRPAAECARSREHPLESVVAKTEEILLDFAAGALASDSYCALIDELNLTPKPGLVDKNNSGAHFDMNYALFCKSAAALVPFFRKAVLIGAKSSGLASLEAEGILAEKTMFAATGGVNTHKGAIFLFMLILYGFGKYFADGESPFEAASALAAEKRAAADTHGAEIRAKYGAAGALEEAVSGFSASVLGAELLTEGKAPLRVLFEIMSRTSDTNVLFRGGKAALDFVRQSAAKALLLPDEKLAAESARLDSEFISRGISPGGCADLFALSLFISREFSQNVLKNTVICVKAAYSDLLQIKAMFSALIEKMASEGLFIWDNIYPACAFSEDIAENRLYLLKQGDSLLSVFALGNDLAGSDFPGWESPSAKALFLMRLGVNPLYSKKGFGILSVKKAAAFAKAAGAKYLRLFVAADNVPAIRFYENFGFCRTPGVFRNEIAPAEFIDEYGYELKL